jgi:hypothetical protein
MNQCPPGPQVFHWGRFEFFRKFAEILTKLFSGVNDTGDKLFSGVNDTGEKFIAGVKIFRRCLFTGVNDTGDKLFGGVNDTGD